MTIERNIGTLDRVLRLVLSGAMVYFGFFSNYLLSDHLAAMALGIFGAANVVVALLGFCPLYRLIGLNTHARRPESPA